MVPKRFFPVIAVLALCLAFLVGWSACASYVSGALAIYPRGRTPVKAVIGPGLVPTIVRSDGGSCDASVLYGLANVPQVIGVFSEAVIFATDSGTPLPGIPDAVAALRESTDTTVPTVRWLSGEYDPDDLVFDLRGVARVVTRAVVIGDPAKQVAEFYILTPGGDWFKVATNMPAARVIEFSDYARAFAEAQMDD